MPKKSKPQLIPEDRKEEVILGLINNAERRAIYEIECTCGNIEQSDPGQNDYDHAASCFDYGWRALQPTAVQKANAFSGSALCPTCAEKISPRPPVPPVVKKRNS